MVQMTRARQHRCQGHDALAEDRMLFFCFYFHILTKTWIPEQATSPILSRAPRLGVASPQTSLLS